MNFKSALLVALSTYLLSSGTVHSEELSKQDYLAMPAKASKHFQCAALLSITGNILKRSAAIHVLASSFTQKGYELGKQYFEAIDSDKITIIDLTLDIPSEFIYSTTSITTSDRQQQIAFNLGRISINAAGDLAEKMEITPLKDRDIDLIKIKQKSKVLIDEYCDYDALEMPPQLLERLRNDLN
ncbi:hypothetical protein KQ944_01800 [Bacillus subtilis]|uniref:hypothetical protein n=1 Tax=Pseudochrobactrum asaccharolyticum TaxID=354351 RepID=UPI001F3EAD7B|nr:hypothetical protein [Pseudochrobactrum asaccharolyticum]MCF7644412.1 hypothetical protein [Pseudochrobactrum asaccharolyticum]MCF7670349.1 hypothetical protein [Bacillus subtilis]